MKKLYLMIETDDQSTSAEPFQNRKDAEKKMIIRFLEVVDDIHEEDEKTLDLLSSKNTADSVIGDLVIAEDNYGVNRHGAWYDDGGSYGCDWSINEIEIPDTTEDRYVSIGITKRDYDLLAKNDDMKVRFLTDTVDGNQYIPEYETPDDLYDDWMGECEYVPENDALVVLPFGRLMEIIQYYKGEDANE